MQLSLSRRSLAEFLGTFWLVFGGCGAAVLDAAFPSLGIGFAGVALAFGLTVLTMAFAIGHISGCHLNPAVSIGLAVARRFPARDLPAYIVAQVAGGIAGAGVLLIIASGKARRIFAARMPDCGSGVDLHVPGHHPGRYRQARAARLRPYRHRLRTHVDPPDRDPGDQSFREPGAQHGSSDLRRRMGHQSIVVVLGSSHHRRSAVRHRVFRAVRRITHRNPPHRRRFSLKKFRKLRGQKIRGHDGQASGPLQPTTR
jgi:hypothetical protein